MPSDIPNYKRVITAHNEKGEAIVSKIDTAAPWETNIEGGKAAFSLGYLTTNYPVEMSDEKDVKSYEQKLADPPGIVQHNGTVLRVVVSARLRPRLKYLLTARLGHGSGDHQSYAQDCVSGLRCRDCWRNRVGSGQWRDRSSQSW